MARLAQLGHLGLTLSEKERSDLARYAKRLREMYAVHEDDDEDDWLLEIADVLDMMARPIVVTRG